MRHLIEAAYIGLDSPQPARAARYLQEVVGLIPAAAGPDGALAFRADDKVYRVWIREGARSDASVPAQKKPASVTGAGGNPAAPRRRCRSRIASPR